MLAARVARTFEPLRDRNFLLVYLSTLLSGGAMQVESLSLAWYVLELTGSPFLTGLITTARQAATVLGVYSGAISDRVSRRGIIIGMQAMSALTVGIIILLIMTGLIAVWHVFAGAVIVGIGRIFDNPARQALVADSAPQGRVSNAVALNNTSRNIMQAASPIVGGVVFAIFGAAGAYTALFLFFAFNVLTMLFVRVAEAPQVSIRTESIWRSMLGGMSYVRRKQVILALLLLAGIANLTGFPFGYAILPVFTKEVLDAGPTGLGFILSGVGLGALAGSILVASISSTRRMGMISVVSLVAWHVVTLAVVNSPSVTLAFGFMVIVGITQSLGLVTIAAVLLSTTEPAYRGRIMGLRSLAVYPLPLGSMITGAMVTWFGIYNATLFNIALGAALVGLTVLVIPSVWRPIETKESAVTKQAP